MIGGIPIGWQFAEKAGNSDNRVFYEYPKLSKLILPTTMERVMLENNISAKSNASTRNYKAYTEIFMVKGEKGEKIPVQELFYTNEKAKEKLATAIENSHPIMLDPSSGTVVSFDEEKVNDIERE